MYTYIYTYTKISFVYTPSVNRCIHIHKHTHTHIQTYLYVHLYIYTHTHIYTHIHILLAVHGVALAKWAGEGHRPYEQALVRVNPINLYIYIYICVCVCVSGLTLDTPWGQGTWVRVLFFYTRLL